MCALTVEFGGIELACNRRQKKERRERTNQDLHRDLRYHLESRQNHGQMTVNLSRLTMVSTGSDEEDDLIVRAFFEHRCDNRNVLQGTCQEITLSTALRDRELTGR